MEAEIELLNDSIDTDQLDLDPAQVYDRSHLSTCYHQSF